MHDNVELLMQKAACSGDFLSEGMAKQLLGLFVID